MIRNLKALGLALLAVVALSAIGAQEGTAAIEHEFISDSTRTIITGGNTGSHEFTIGSVGTVKCNKATFEGTVSEGLSFEVDRLTVKPTYHECSFGGQFASVFFNDCAYVFDTDTNGGNSTGGLHAAATIECAFANKVQIHTANCTITIGAQEVPAALSYTNDGSSSFGVVATAHGITVGKERSTAAQPVNGCLLFPTGAVGKYVGTTTYDCRKDENEASEFNPTTPSVTWDFATTECDVV